MASRFKVYFFQAIGYFIAFKTEIHSPPVVFVLTESVVKILLFPFMSKHGNLCIALELKDLDLWTTSSFGYRELNWKTLTFLALLTFHRPACTVQFEAVTVGELKRTLQDKVLTDKDIEVTLLKTQLQEQQKAMAEKDQALQQAMAEKDQALQQAMAEKDQALQQAMAEKDQALQQAMAEKDQALQQAMAEKDQALQQAMAEKDQALQQALAEKDHAIQPSITS